MITVSLKPLTLEGKECIGIYFDNHSSINGAIRKHAGARWDPSAKAWWVSLSQANYNKLLVALKGKVKIEKQELYQYLESKKKKEKLSVSIVATKKNGKRGNIFSNGSKQTELWRNRKNTPGKCPYITSTAAKA